MKFGIYGILSVSAMAGALIAMLAGWPSSIAISSLAIASFAGLAGSGACRKRLEIISGAGAAVLVVDASGKVKDCNSDCHRILDMPPASVVGSWQWLDRVDHHDRFRVQLALKKGATRAHAEAGLEVKFWGQNGPPRQFLLHVVDHNSAKLKVVSLTDITERRRVMDVLRHREEVMDRVFETMDDGLVVLDENRKVTHWNHAMEKILGIPATEMTMADDAVEVFERWTYFNAKKFIADALAGKSTQAERTLHMAHHAEPMEIMTLVRPIRGPRGEVSGVIGLIRDVTQVKRAREEIVKAKELAESASNAKSEFLANVSHELRTPINGIVGLLNLVIDEPLEDQQRLWISMAIDSAKSLTKVINNILEYTTMESGLTSPSSSQMSPAVCARDALEAIKPSAAAKSIATSLQVSDDVPELLMGDASRLRQVLQHLLNNAVKFSDEGEIRVDISVLNNGIADGEIADGDENCVELLFEISDNGVGVPDERKREIFEAFTQADGSSTRRFNGAGLGLAICQKTVRQMGGEIKLRDNIERGSVFSFNIKFASPMAEATSCCEQGTKETIDLKACISRLGGDMQLLGEIAELFIGEAPQQLSDIAKSLESEQMDLAASVTHTFKGTVGNFQIISLMDSAKRLETFTRDGCVDAARGELGKLKAMTDQLIDALQQIGKENAAPEDINA